VQRLWKQQLLSDVAQQMSVAWSIKGLLLQQKLIKETLILIAHPPPHLHKA